MKTKAKKSDTKNRQKNASTTLAEKAENHLRALIGEMEVAQLLALPRFKRALVYALLED